jgi:putative ABC transport system permease protein
VRTRVPIAWLILTADRPRLAVSCARLAFAVVLVFSQLGFLDSSMASTRRLLDRMNADLFLVHRSRFTLFLDEEFPRGRLHQARAVPGVASARAVYHEDHVSFWRNPQGGNRNVIRVLAFDPSEQVFLGPEVNSRLAGLRESDTALVDASARPLLGTAPAGTWSELNRRRVRVVGQFHLGPDYRYDGNLLMSDTNFFRYFPRRDPGRVALGLLSLEAGSDPAAVARAVQETLPVDVECLTRAGMTEREQRYWNREAAVGIVFGFGLLVGLAVGIITCYQIVYLDIHDLLPQLAVLKAMGRPDRDLVRIVFEEALLLGLIGFVPGVLLSMGVFALLEEWSGITMTLTVGLVLKVVALTAGMACTAALLAVREVFRADPAELLR